MGIDTGACLSAGWEGFKKNPVNHIVAVLLVGAVSSVGMGLLTGPMMVGYMRMMMREAEGQTTSAGDVFKGFEDFVPGLIVGLLGSIIVSAGYAFCFIPGLLLAPLMPYALYIVAAGEKDGVAALKRAFDMLQAHLVPGAICWFVLSLVAVLGLVGCFVGLLVTAPIAAIGSFYMARMAAGEGALARG
ncbi:MAG: hypothetical protein FJ137_05030 [Deltaproteobacteria bacterium]|nr:hypothetical protein [Deltaproteobacteria bacterium]